MITIFAAAAGVHSFLAALNAPTNPVGISINLGFAVFWAIKALTHHRAAFLHEGRNDAADRTASQSLQEQQP